VEHEQLKGGVLQLLVGLVARSDSHIPDLENLPSNKVVDSGGLYTQ
jgi:hypothetical protein